MAKNIKGLGFEEDDFSRCDAGASLFWSFFGQCKKVQVEQFFSLVITKSPQAKITNHSTKKATNPCKKPLIKPTNTTMTIEIWSDIVCPWCYIGKRRLEKALTQFKHANAVEIEYKSYQLNPDMPTDTSMSINQYLSVHKGISMQEAEQMSQRVSQIAQEEGLQYQLDKAIPVNTFKAHRLLHLAKEKGVQAELKEALLHAYFINATNVDDHAILLKLATAVGLEETAVQNVLTTDTYKADVERDIHEGIQLGLQGVPFFVIDRKYGVSGAQGADVFLRALQRAHEEG